MRLINVPTFVRIYDNGFIFHFLYKQKKVHLNMCAVHKIELLFPWRTIILQSFNTYINLNQFCCTASTHQTNWCTLSNESIHIVVIYLSSHIYYKLLLNGKNVRALKMVLNIILIEKSSYDARTQTNANILYTKDDGFFTESIKGFDIGEHKKKKTKRLWQMEKIMPIPKRILNVIENIAQSFVVNTKSISLYTRARVQLKLFVLMFTRLKH